MCVCVKSGEKVVILLLSPDMSYWLSIFIVYSLLLCTWSRLFLLKIFLMFYLFLRERARTGGEEGQREKETQNLKQAPGLMPGLNSKAVKPWPELKLDA